MLSEDGRKSIVILTCLTFLATVFLILRLSIRKSKYISTPEDGLLCFALFMLYLQDAGAFLFALKGGEGKPMASLTPDELYWFLQMSFWPELGYTILIATIKSSILLSYKRIFGRIRWFRYAVYTVGTFTAIWFFGVFFSVLFQCTPVDKSWNPTKPGHCIDLLPFLWGNSISNNIIDYLILFLPVVPVWQLQLKPLQKCLVLGSFALGSVACVASTLRAVSTGTVDLADLSGTVFEASIWTYIEPTVGIVSACLPFLANIFGHRLLDFLKFLSTKASSLLRLHSTGTRNWSTRESGTRRAGYESYELDQDTKPSSSKPRSEEVQTESVEDLV